MTEWRNNKFFYVLGLILTDGCLSQQYKKNVLSFLSKDEDLVAMVAEITKTNYHKYKNYYRLDCRDQNIIKEFTDYGLHYRKSLDLCFPSNIPLEYMSDFVRGCIDGDGSIGLYKNSKNTKLASCYLCSSSSVFIKGFRNLLDLLKLRYTFVVVSPRKRIFNNKSFISKEHYVVKFKGSKALDFLKWCNYDSNISSLRKRKVYQEVINYYNNKNNTRFNLTNKIDWPADHILFDMVKSHNINYVANKLGISFNAVKGRLKRRNFFN